MAEIRNTTSGEGWKVRIDRLPYMDRVNFYIYRPTSGGATIMGPNGTLVSVKDGEYIGNIGPTLSLTNFDAKTIMVALAEAISEEGVRTPDSHRLQGTLDAQAKHLEDLRTLLKLNKHRGDQK